MTRKFIFVVALFLSITGTAQPLNWIRLDKFPPDVALYHLQILNNNTLMVFGNGIIYRSKDEGVNWQALPMDASLRMHSFHFIDDDIGWAAGENKTILHTTDGGTNWSIQYQDTTSDFRFYHVKFVDEHIGWASGASSGSRGDFLYTTDGGSTWSSKNQTIYPFMVHSDIVGNQSAWAVGIAGAIFHTDDGGERWFRQQFDTPGDLIAVDFVDKQTGWAVGGYGVILHTSDGGANWEMQYVNDTVLAFLSVSFINERDGWVVGYNGAIFYTEDGGSNWLRYYSDTNAYLYSVAFSRDGTGWITGGDGTLYRSTLKNVVGIDKPETDIPNTIALLENYPNPFNPSTTIRYALPENTFVNLQIFNVLGQPVRTLVNRELPPGNQSVEWEGKNDRGQEVSSGIYFYRIEADGFARTRRMVLLR